MFVSRLSRTALALAATLLAMPAAQAADAYPSRPITMVVPFPAGGPTDLIARVLGVQLSQQMGQTVVIENKGGANANIGMQYAASARPDGYTLLYNTSSIALNPNLYSNLAYDPRKDFTPVSTTAVVPMVLLTHPSVPAQDVAQFIAHAKANPGKLSYGSASAGNVTHLGAFLFLQAAGVDAVHVPYRGSAPALADLAGGQVQFMVNTINDSRAFVADQRVRALAVTSAQRSAVLPDVPTLAETVAPGFDMGAWQGVVVPAGTPPAIVARLNQEIRTALASDTMRTQLAQQGAQVLGSTPEEYAAYLDSEIKRWGEVVQAAGVRLD